MANEIGPVAKATGAEPHSGSPQCLITHLNRKAKTLCRSDAPNNPETAIEALDRPTSSGAALPQSPHKRVVGEDRQSAAAVASPPSAITPPPSQTYAHTTTEEQEWQIRRILSKRQDSFTDPRLLYLPSLLSLAVFVYYTHMTRSVHGLDILRLA